MGGRQRKKGGMDNERQRLRELDADFNCKVLNLFGYSTVCDEMEQDGFVCIGQLHCNYNYMLLD